jgi:hypothetical protein
MTPEEAKSAIDTLKKDGLGDEEILYSFYRMFQDDKITIEGLEGLVETLGWHLTEEFKAMSPEDQKTKGYEEIEDEGGEGATETEIEAVKEYPDKADEVSDTNPQTDGSEETKAEPASTDDKDEEKEAMKLFGMK